MAQTYKPICWVHGYRKERATLLAVRDPCKTLKPYRAAGLSRQLDQKKHRGVLTLYCDGNHLYLDTIYFRYLYSGYQYRGGHRGLHLVPRKTFNQIKWVTLGTTNSSDDTFFMLRHDGFTGKPGEKTAHVWFQNPHQFARPWELEVQAGQMLNLILDDDDWHLETLWLRQVTMNRIHLDRTRHLIPSQD